MVYAMLHSNCKLPFIFTYIRTPENTHGLSQKIQGTYFKISALYFKIYGLYFPPFQMLEKQCLEKGQKSAVSGCGFGGSENEKKLVCCHDWGIKVAW